MRDSDVPYFMWDERLTCAELKQQLRTAPTARKVDLMAKIMRDANDQDVWEFMTPEDLAKFSGQIFPRLGWHKGFWVFLYNKWVEHGLLKAEPYTDQRPGRLS